MLCGPGNSGKRAEGTILYANLNVHAKALLQDSRMQFVKSYNLKYDNP